ncbi:MATE family multidrug resistance protein [Lentzea atacamensis]|uniref:Probable multidrug resistance protein NorM n=1 Tax=Lentzea atacamensis TaxID=531938 RepID=A0A316HQX2_9PSEU|nr:MATE family efflux transporter [Lentzea atacamensis]PWK83701.1 MATE family multidrug resistance protein [Lentzea atacamensis]RAS70370.1 MATE family multidrug resistance protein [Lentzea atacamensis]
MLLSDARSIGRVALPLYLSMVAVSLGALVNTAALGRYGTEALAAFAVTTAVYFPATAAVAGAVRGVMPFVAAKADDPPELLRVVRNGTWLAVFVGVPAALAVAGAGVIARAGGVPAATVAQLGPFPLLMAAAMLVGGFGSTATSCLVGLGRSKVVMRAGLAGAASTAVLSPLLVWKLGLNGAGIALCTANLVSCLITVSGLRGRLPGRLGRTIHFGQIRELAKVGIPMAGTVLVKFAVLGVLTVAAARVSTTAVAAHNIATGLAGLTFTAAVAIGQAVVPLVSTRTEGVRRAVIAGLTITVATLAAICAVIVLGGAERLFTDDPEVRAAVAGLLALLVVVVLADGLQAVLGFGLAGLKRTTPSFVIFSGCYGVLAVIAVPAAQHGLTGLWAALAAANLAVAVGQGLAFRRASNL